MAALEGSIQILAKTDADITALGNPFIPLKGQCFFVTDTGEFGIGDGSTAYASLTKISFADVLARLTNLEQNTISTL